MCEGSGCHVVRDLNSDEQRGNCFRSNNGQQDRTNRPYQPPQVPQTASPSPKQSRKRITACTNCRLTHRKCSEGRPCKTCVALGIADSCQDPPRRKATQYHNIFVDWSSVASGSSRPSRSSTSSSSSSSSSLSFLHHQFSPSVVMTSTDMDSTNNGTLPSFVRNSPEGSKGKRRDGAVLMISQDKHDDGACSGGDLSRSYDSTASLSNNDNSTSSNHSCGSCIVSRDQSQYELSSGLVGDFQQSTQLPHVDRTNFGHIQGGGGGCDDTRPMPPSSPTAPQQQQQVRSLLAALSSSPQHEQQQRQSQFQLQSAQQARHLLTQWQQPQHVQHQTFNDARTLVSQFMNDTSARLNTDYSDIGRYVVSPQLQKHEENQSRQEQQQQPFNSTRTQLSTPHSPSSLSPVIVPVVPPGSSTAQPRTQLESLQTTSPSSNQYNYDGESHNGNNCQRIQHNNPCEHKSTNNLAQISIRMNNEEKAYRLSPIHSVPEFRKSRGKSSIFPHLETLLPSHDKFYTPPTVFFPLCWLKKSTAATSRGIVQSVVGVTQVQMSSRVGGVQQHVNRSRSSSTSPSSSLSSSMAPSISKRKHHRPRSQFPD